MGRIRSPAGELGDQEIYSAKWSGRAGTSHPQIRAGNDFQTQLAKLRPRHPQEEKCSISEGRRYQKSSRSMPDEAAHTCLREEESCTRKKKRSRTGTHSSTSVSTGPFPAFQFLSGALIAAPAQPTAIGYSTPLRTRSQPTAQPARVQRIDIIRDIDAMDKYLTGDLLPKPPALIWYSTRTPFV